MAIKRLSMRVVLWLNAALGVALLVVSLYTLSTAKITVDEHEATMYLVAAVWFLLIAISIASQSRVMVTIGAIPVILFSCFLVFAMAFAPLAWGPSNTGTALVIALCSAAMICLQVIGVLLVFRAHRSP